LNRDRECRREQAEQSKSHRGEWDPQRPGTVCVKRDGAQRSVERGECRPTHDRERRSGDQVAVGYPERVAEQQLL